LIGPSLLAADLSRLAEESERVLACGADYLHLDVMDGHFVPNLTFGAPVIKSLRKNLPDKEAVFFDVHLMVSHPRQWVQDMAEAGASNFTFHLETCSELLPSSDVSALDLCREVKATGMLCGVSIKPNTAVDTLFALLDEDKRLREEEGLDGLVDLVLIMTVEPGFGGQAFMSEMMAKVQVLRERYPTLPIEVDGGLGPSTIEEASQAGATMIVAGSSVFKAEDPAEVIRGLRESVQRAGFTQA
jgi:ribulose-phosphate 3-epimerase